MIGKNARNICFRELWKDVAGRLVHLLRALLLCMLLGITLVPTGGAQAAKLYEGWNTTDSAYPETHGTRWFSQPFTTVGAHLVTSVRLKMWRSPSDYPEQVTISIRVTDGSGNPIGSDLAVGNTTDVNNLPTTYTTSVWRDTVFGTPYLLNAATQYAVVIRSVNILYIAASLPILYTGGTCRYCDDGIGNSWNPSTSSILFGIYGPEDAGDYNGDGKAEAAIYRPSTGLWMAYGCPSGTLGGSGYTPTPGDFNGDGKWEAAVWQSSTGTWSCYGLPSGVFGQSGDIPVPGDYNGDGKAEAAIYRPTTGLWMAYGSPSGIWGGPGYTAVPGDYNGDGKWEAAVWQESTGTWSCYGLPSGVFGQSGDIPVPGDYNGDGKWEAAVYRPSTGLWMAYGSPSGIWGGPGYTATPGDFNGDGKLEAAVWQSSTGTWSCYGLPSGVFGQSGDTPVVYAK